MLKKIAKIRKKKYTGPPPHEHFFFLWGTKGKKLPLWHQMEKTFFGGPKEIKTSFFQASPLRNFFFSWSLKGSFFLLVPQRKFFSLWSPKGKKFAHGGEGRRKSFYFLGNFFKYVKKLINFLNFLNIKVAKSKSFGFLLQIGFF